MTEILPQPGAAALDAPAQSLDGLASLTHTDPRGRDAQPMHAAEHPTDFSGGLAGALTGAVCRGAVIVALWLGY